MHPRRVHKSQESAGLPNPQQKGRVHPVLAEEQIHSADKVEPLPCYRQICDLPAR